MLLRTMVYPPTTAPVTNAPIPTNGRAAASSGVDATRAVPDKTDVATPTPAEDTPPTALAMSRPFRIFVPGPQDGER